MKATKCDRCKQYYAEEIPLITYKYPEESARFELDLCYKCLKDFVKFMKEYEDDQTTTPD